MVVWRNGVARYLELPEITFCARHSASKLSEDRMNEMDSKGMNESEYVKNNPKPGQYPAGAKIRFKRELSQGPTEETPAFLFATENGTGVITGHGTWEGYWVKWDKWPSSFGCKEEDFEVIDGTERFKGSAKC